MCQGFSRIRESLVSHSAALSGKPWQVRGAQQTRVPMLEVDPVPHVEASVNDLRAVNALYSNGAPATGNSSGSSGA